MAWIKEKVFYCLICGRIGIGVQHNEMPEGWTGSDRRRGDCYCRTCSKDIAILKVERKRVSEDEWRAQSLNCEKTGLSEGAE